jgi:4,5-dihydroxyphthalate decarboxylase
MGKVSITIATWDYDRVRPLMDGRVKVEGCDFNFIVVKPEECFHRAWYHQEFDVTEIGVSGYYVAISRGTERGNFGISPYVAIPVYPSRLFRASAIYIRTDRGIEKPADLRGKKIGVPEYQMTAAVFARGFLSDEYGVKVEDINWMQGGMDNPDRTDKWPNNLPAGFPLRALKDVSLNQALEEGKIDAAICARAPRAYAAGNPIVRRLFPDFETIEKDYYRRTKIYPIMHLLGIRRSLYEQHPWIARNLYQAFCEAKAITQEELFEITALKIGLPWVVSSAESARKVLGDDIYPYGYESALPTLKAMSRFLMEQHITVRPVDPEELFPATTMSEPKR